MPRTSAHDYEPDTSWRETPTPAPPLDPLMTDEEHLDAMAGTQMLGTVLIGVVALSVVVVALVSVLFAVFY